jgi:hypothetical protein
MRSTYLYICTMYKRPLRPDTYIQVRSGHRPRAIGGRGVAWPQRGKKTPLPVAPWQLSVDTKNPTLACSHFPTARGHKSDGTMHVHGASLDAICPSDKTKRANAKFCACVPSVCVCNNQRGEERGAAAVMAVIVILCTSRRKGGERGGDDWEVWYGWMHECRS